MWTLHQSVQRELTRSQRMVPERQKSGDIKEEVILHIQGSQLPLVRMPPSCLPREVLQTCPPERTYQDPGIAGGVTSPS